MKKALILGAGKSGLAALKALRGYDVINVIITAQEYQSDLSSIIRNLGGTPHLPDCLIAENIPTYDLIIRSPGFPSTNPLIHLIKKHRGNLLSEIEFAYLLAPQAKYLAITGSNGKTTIASLIYHLLRKKYGKHLYLAGNIGLPLSSIASSLDQDSVVVLELSSFQLEDISLFSPLIALISNLAPNHLDSVANLEDYYQSKMKILSNISHSGVFILNGDDKEIINRLPPKLIPIWRIGQEEGAIIRFDSKNLYCNEQTIFELDQCRLKGVHNHYNIAMAVSVALLMEMPLSQIIKDLKTFQPIQFRLEFIKRHQDVDYYNDSKSTSLHATIAAIKAFGKRNIYLIVGGKDKQLSYHQLNDQDLKKIYAYGEIGAKVAQQVDGCQSYENLEAAFNAVRNDVVPDSIVLFSPGTSSYDQYRDYQERGRHFNQLVSKL